ncbi:MAG: carboxypeptidase-like regulatory domain-containing protein, partial [Candidatus Margulisbacteria bacterium]|nr:carboxypeptidase-like regulatory domain-containing protein [Candidatus Margulisiibacteriota bacterium]
MSKKAIGLLFILVFVVALAVGCGQVVSNEETGNEEVRSTGKTISGQITDLTSGAPLPGALIYAGGKTTTTNSSGNYTLEGISFTSESIT